MEIDNSARKTTCNDVELVHLRYVSESIYTLLNIIITHSKRFVALSVLSDLKLGIPVLTVLLPRWCSIRTPIRDMVDRRSIHLVKVCVCPLLGGHMHVPEIQLSVLAPAEP